MERRDESSNLHNNDAAEELMLNGTPPSWDRKTQPGLFDDAHQVGAVRRALAPRTKVMTSAEQAAEQMLRYALLQNENWQAEGGGKHYLFVCTTKDKAVMPSTLQKLTRKILQDDLGIGSDACSIDLDCHHHSGASMIIRVPAALLDSKCDVMEAKLQALTATVNATPTTKGPARWTVENETRVHSRETGWSNHLVDKTSLNAPRHERSEIHPPTKRDHFQIDRTAVPQSKAGQGR